MNKRIRWSEEEWQTVATNVSSHLINNPGATLPSAYDSIKSVLPKNRRRSIISVKSFDPIIGDIKRLMAKEAPSPVPTPEPVVKIVDRVEYRDTDISDISTKDLQDEINRRMFMPIIEEITDKATQKIINKISDIIGILDNTEISKKSDNKSSEDKRESKTGKNKVLIVGLLPEQEGNIKKEFGEFVDLRFFNSKKSTDSLKPLSSGCDQIIVMTKFISHSKYHIVKNSGVPVIHCNGGISGLKNVMEAYCIDVI